MCYDKRFQRDWCAMTNSLSGKDLIWQVHGEKMCYDQYSNNFGAKGDR